ncbi:Protein of unknown function [Cotesia congregata]|uniref:Uncharacterized protein n=1 Tax=Cotesia congregata TaxID=51543 RepID=A0A8J2E6H2_COTCN|nr:Protein of unknown function [Cotesia congregata]
MLHLDHNKLLYSDFRILLAIKDRAVRRNDKSFLITAIKLWKELLSEIVSLQIFNEFKSACYNLF